MVSIQSKISIMTLLLYNIVLSMLKLKVRIDVTWKKLVTSYLRNNNNVRGKIVQKVVNLLYGGQFSLKFLIWSI